MSLLWLRLLLWCMFNPWPGNFCMPWAQQKKKKKEKKIRSARQYRVKTNLHSYVFFVFFVCTCGMQQSEQGTTCLYHGDLNHSSDPSHSNDNARSLAHLATSQVLQLLLVLKTSVPPVCSLSTYHSTYIVKIYTVIPFSQTKL